VLWTGVLMASACLLVQGQEAPGKEMQAEIRGLPPRATPGDYQAKAQAGQVTIGAEFMEHGVPTAEGTLTTDDYVSVEVGLFGPAGSRVTLTPDDFTLVLTTKKKEPLPTRQFGLVIASGSLKDPEWQPPEEPKSKSKTALGGGGDDQTASNAPPPPVKIPFEVQRAMALKVQKAALPEGDRALPVAGVIFFQYRGNVKKIHSVELVYSGSAGKATIPLQP
jgi:hypothetical protein